MEKFVYKVKPKGRAAFSGRSQAKMAANLAAALAFVEGSARAGQKKQVKGK